MYSYIHVSDKLPYGFWNDKDNRKSFMTELGEKLNIKDFSDWYSITSEQIKNHGGDGLLRRYGGSPSKLLTSVFPQYPRVPERVSNTISLNIER